MSNRFRSDATNSMPTRKSLRPQNDPVVQSGVIPTHRDMKGKVIAGKVPDAPTGGGMVHRDTKGQPIAPARSWRQPAAPTAPPAPTATPTQTVSPQPTAPSQPSPAPLQVDWEVAKSPTPTPQPSAVPAVQRETFTEIAARRAKESAASGAFGTGAQTAAKRASAGPLEKALEKALSAARAKQSAQTLAAAPAAPKQPTVGQQRRAKMDAEAQGMIAQAGALSDVNRAVKAWRQPLAPGRVPTDPAAATAMAKVEGQRVRAGQQTKALVAATAPPARQSGVAAPTPGKQASMAWKTPPAAPAVTKPNPVSAKDFAVKPTTTKPLSIGAGAPVAKIKTAAPTIQQPSPLLGITGAIKKDIAQATRAYKSGVQAWAGTIMGAQDAAGSMVKGVQKVAGNTIAASVSAPSEIATRLIPGETGKVIRSAGIPKAIRRNVRAAGQTGASVINKPFKIARSWRDKVFK